MKLHFGNSGVDVKNPQHVEKLRRFFRAANAHRLALVAHLWITGGSYGREHSEIFLNQLLPEAPDIPVQIAHMAGAGPGYAFDDALGVYAKALAAGDPRTKNLYFDMASNVPEERRPRRPSCSSRSACGRWDSSASCMEPTCPSAPPTRRRPRPGPRCGAGSR